MIKTGALNFHSETGTEGGYYTLQDAEFIAYVKPWCGVFNHTKVCEPGDPLKSGKVVRAYKKDGTSYGRGRPGDVSILDIDWGDEAPPEIGRRSNTVLIERWDYGGLVYLENGDRLTVFERGIGSLALWSSEVSLEEQDPYAQDSYAVGEETEGVLGLATHHRPLNTAPATPDEWSTWFLQSRWATLERPE